MPDRDEIDRCYRHPLVAAGHHTAAPQHSRLQRTAKMKMASLPSAREGEGQGGQCEASGRSQHEGQAAAKPQGLPRSCTQPVHLLTQARHLQGKRQGKGGGPNSGQQSASGGLVAAPRRKASRRAPLCTAPLLPAATRIPVGHAGAKRVCKCQQGGDEAAHEDIVRLDLAVNGRNNADRHAQHRQVACGQWGIPRLGRAAGRPACCSLPRCIRCRTAGSAPSPTSATQSGIPSRMNTCRRKFRSRGVSPASVACPPSASSPSASASTSLPAALSSAAAAAAAPSVPLALAAPASGAAALAAAAEALAARLRSRMLM